MADDLMQLKSCNLLRASEDHAFCYRWLLRMVDAKEGAPKFHRCCDVRATRISSAIFIALALLVGFVVGCI